MVPSLRVVPEFHNSDPVIDNTWTVMGNTAGKCRTPTPSGSAS
jgi:hypothetical protein